MALGKRNVHVSKPLSEFALIYLQDNDNFIANKVAPPVAVKKETDKYFVFDRTNWQLAEDLRAPGSESNRVAVPQPSTDSYNIEEHALHENVPWREIEEADDPLLPQQDTTTFLMEKLLIQREIETVKTFFTITAVANSASITAATKWDATTGSTPIDDIDTGIDTVQQEIGYTPKNCVIGEAVWKVLKRHNTLIDLIKYTQKGVLTKDLAASIWDFDTFLIGKSVQMTTNEGIASEAVSYIWDKKVLISYVPKGKPNKKRTSHGYQFVKKGENVQMKTWENEAKESTIVEGSIYYDMKIASSLCAYMLVDPVT